MDTNLRGAKTELENLCVNTVTSLLLTVLYFPQSYKHLVPVKQIGVVLGLANPVMNITSVLTGHISGQTNSAMFHHTAGIRVNLPTYIYTVGGQGMTGGPRKLPVNIEQAHISAALCWFKCRGSNDTANLGCFTYMSDHTQI